MLNYSQNPYNVLSEVISFDNVQKMGEMLTLKSLRTRSTYPRYNLEWLYLSFIRDLNHRNEPHHVFSDAYDLVQVAVCFLCEFIGKKLTDVYMLKNGHEVTIKHATYMLVGRNIDRMRRHIARHCDLEKARFEGDFLIARNAKRKNGKIEYKKIPICKQAREMLDLNAPVEALHRTDVLNRIFKRIMEDEEVTQYFLRHTFASTCKQFVTRSDVVDLWMGDSPEKLVDRVYTHFPDDFMQGQMALVKFYA